MHHRVGQSKRIILAQIAVFCEYEMAVSPGQPVEPVEKSLKNGVFITGLSVEFQPVVLLYFIHNLPTQKPEQQGNRQQLRHKQVNDAGAVSEQVPHDEWMHQHQPNGQFWIKRQNAHRRGNPPGQQTPNLVFLPQCADYFQHTRVVGRVGRADAQHPKPPATCGGHTSVNRRRFGYSNVAVRLRSGRGWFRYHTVPASGPSPEMIPETDIAHCCCSPRCSNCRG